MAELAINGGAPVRHEPYPHWPQAGPEELEELRAVLDSGNWTSSHGEAVRRFESSFAGYQGARHAICVSSGEIALQLALTAAGLPPGGEVIIPAYTFVASATAVISAGGVPVFADVEPGTYCLNAEKAAELVGADTAAIMPVHMGGLPADMDPLLALAGERGLTVIEDAAQAWGARYRDRPVGALGDAGAFSFQASKNITAGEGGAILTNDEALAAACRSLSDCGRAATGQRYRHTMLGGNYRLSEFQGGVLNAQLGRYAEQLAGRERNAGVLRDALRRIPGVEPQVVGSEHTHAWHLLIVRIRADEFAGAAKQAIVDALIAEGVPATAGYLDTPYQQPLFDAASGVAPAFRRGDCPVAETACAREVLWFRQTALLGSEHDALDVATALAKVQEHRGELQHR